MNRPCASCPFLREQVRMLRPGRKREIAAALRRGGEFPCHKTLNYETEDGNPRRTKQTAFCAGAVLTMENGGGAGAYANQMVRIYTRIGGLNLDELQGHDLVFGSLAEFVRGGPKTRTDSEGSSSSTDKPM